MSLVRDIIRRVLPIKYRRQIRLAVQYGGLKLQCNCCGRTWRKLVIDGKVIPVIEESHITSMGLLQLCPNCYSRSRDRLLYYYLLHETDFFTSKAKVLHVAPEYFLGHLLLNHPTIRYLSADIEIYDPIVMEVMDITDIKYDDNSFDIVICNHVLEHVPDDRKAMSELYRVLGHGGWAILLVPISYDLDKTFEDQSVISKEDRERVFGQNDHVRIYGPDYKERLESVGFSINTWRTRDYFTPQQISRYALIPEETLYICTK